MVMENKAPCHVLNIGKVRLKLLDGTFRTLDHVQNVSNSKKNLILLVIFYSEGYEFTSGGGALKVSKVSRLYWKGEKCSSYIVVLILIYGLFQICLVNFKSFMTFWEPKAILWNSVWIYLT